MYQNRNLCFEVEDFTKKGKSYENLHKFVDLLLDQEQVIKIHIPRWNELPDLDLYLDQVVNYVEINHLY